MRILYYVTAHGYGHGVRTAAICREFSPEVKVVFRTGIPLKFFREEVQKAFEYFPSQFDVGCIQKDSVTTDRGKTLRAYMSIAQKNQARLEEEVKWTREQGIDGIIGDITPFAFEVAARAGLPSVAVSNFSWYDIYRPYAESFPEFQPCLRKILQQYEAAGLLLELMPSTGMPGFRNRLKVPLVGGAGVNVRQRLKEHLRLNKEKNLGLIYVGEFGMDCVSWPNLKNFTGWDFIGIYPLPGNPSNYHVVKKEDFPYLDLVASVDVMVSKIGYGIFCQSLLNGIPLIYLPREDFAEFPVLERAMIEWGHAYRLSREEYCKLTWERVLETVSTREKPEPRKSDGAKICAREIERWISGSSRGSSLRGRAE